MHDRATCAQSFTYGVTDGNRHVTLRLQVGMAFRTRNDADTVCTVVHELSHRIVPTADEGDPVCPSPGAECCGQADCRAAHAASRYHALNNAESCGSFVCACNDLAAT